jgi:hypothetical protein
MDFITDYIAAAHGTRAQATLFEGGYIHSESKNSNANIEAALPQETEILVNQEKSTPFN